MKSIQVKYFSSLRDASKKDQEVLSIESPKKASQIFDELNERYHFSLDRSYIKVAINEAYQDWDTLLHGGETLVFIPPVAGG
ncbi:MAG: molybdopterin synthase sulfur carrier subunit [Halobacteriovoraceae bacterium]|nr:molybdopterin synthase sulfur carrier subunit [Halobacteriovoraceae bacterium]